MTYKLDWGSGPWEFEPDEDDWVDTDTGLRCMAMRHPDLGHWCGYVGFIPGMHLWRVGYNQIERRVDVHGGLTFSGRFKMMKSWLRPYWWIGFDCAHYLDIVPGVRKHYLTEFHGEGCEVRNYRDLEYVRAECKILAKRLSNLRPRKVKRERH
jgi:hypothetical protein